MRYDASRTALLNPQRQPALAPTQFHDRPDALAAELARLAYFDFERDPAPLRLALEEHGLNSIGLFADPSVDSEGFAAIDPAGTGWIAFRGTQPDALRDLVADAKAWPQELEGGGSVHAGFLEAWLGKNPENGMAAQVFSWIDRHRPARMIASGHSLGGALATLCAAEYPVIELVTIGSPRVGDSTFAARFAGRNARRIAQCADLVARVPPPLGFEHVGTLLYVDSLGELHHPAPDTRVIARDRRSAAFAYLRDYALRDGNVLVRDLADHAPINYVSALLGIREN
jgi:pimeloyl-ACP methyl ester carboxylesterase